MTEKTTMDVAAIMRKHLEEAGEDQLRGTGEPSRGSHEALLAEDGLYAELWRRQLEQGDGVEVVD